MSWFSDFFGGAASGATASATGGDTGLDWTKIISAAIPGVIAGIGSYSAPQPYANSQGYLDAKLAQDQAQFMAEMDLKKQALAQQAGAGGAAAGAAIQTARIAAATQLAALKERAAATRLAAQLTAVQGRPDLTNQAQQGLTSAIQAKGQAGQQGFGEIARLLQGYRQ